MAKIKAGQGMPSDELSIFCSEVAMMLSSGMQIYDGMEALAETYANTPRAAMYKKISEGMLTKGSLYDTLSEDPVWPRHLVEMVGVGERTGRLDKVMEGLASYYGREGRIRSAIASAITYPLVLAVMLLVIVFIMIATVLPVFRRMLGSMGVAMTASGSAMMNLGLTIGWVVLAVVGVVVLAVLCVALAMRFGNRKKVLAALRRVFPPLRRQTEKLAASRIFSVLSMMISGGFALDDALSMVPPVLEDEEATAKVEKIRSDMREGVSFGESLEKSRLLDEIHTRMVRMAVSVGREDEVMAKIAATYEEQLENDIADLVAIIEPTLVALLCLVIGAILLSVMLPMAGIITSIL